MTDETYFGLTNGVMRDLTIDIGDDGGTLRIDQSTPFTKYWINGEPVSETRAWEWIAEWHRIRDQALLADPCRCKPCQWWWDREPT